MILNFKDFFYIKALMYRLFVSFSLITSFLKLIYLEDRMTREEETNVLLAGLSSQKPSIARRPRNPSKSLVRILGTHIFWPPSVVSQLC